MLSIPQTTSPTPFPLPHPTPVLCLLFLLVAGAFQKSPWGSIGLPPDFTMTLLISVSPDCLKSDVPSHLRTPLFSSIASLLLLPFPPLEVVSPHQVGLLSIQLLPRKRDCSCLLFLPQCCFPKATYCSFSSFSLCFCDPCCYLTLDHAFFL